MINRTILNENFYSESLDVDSDKSQDIINLSLYKKYISDSKGLKYIIQILEYIDLDSPKEIQYKASANFNILKNNTTSYYYIDSDSTIFELEKYFEKTWRVLSIMYERCMSI